jgi:opacity protein-like surface antigen
MKNILLGGLLACIASQASAFSPYISTSVGYLVDSKKEYITARVGAEFKKADKISNNVEFEIGRYSESHDFGALRFVPLTLNYRGIIPVSKKLSVYVGTGAGASIVDLEATVYTYYYTAITGSYIDFPVYSNSYTSIGKISERSTAFTAQSFGGVEYRATRSFSINAGARYLWVGDAKFRGQTFRVGDDVSLEGGVSYKF